MNDELPIPFDVAEPISDISLDLEDTFGIELGNVKTNYQADPNLPVRRLLKPVPDEPGNYYMEIDNSSLENFTVCHKSMEHYLVYSREAAEPAAALSFGTAIHKALDLRMRYGLSAAVEQKQIEVILDHFVKNPPPPDEFRTADRAIAEIRRYNKKMREPEAFEVLRDSSDEPFVEMPFNFPLFTVELDCYIPYHPATLVQGAESECPKGTTYNEHGTRVNRVYVIWTGRIDAIISMDKKIWVMDHKTTTIGGVTYVKDFELANQMRGYVWAAKQLINADIHGMFLNALYFRPPTKTSTPSEIIRRQFPYRQDQIDEWHEDVQQLIHNFFFALKQGKFPQETKWCYGKYGECQYHKVCLVPKHQRQEILRSQLYRDVTWNPLMPRDLES